MAVEIRELKTADFEALLELWMQGASDGRGDLTEANLARLVRCYPGLSLVALDEAVVVAAVLVDDTHSRADLTLRLVIGTDIGPDSPLVLELIDRALRKAAGQHIRKCQVQLPPAADARPFWERSRWTDWPQVGQASSRTQAAAVSAQRLAHSAGAQPDEGAAANDAAA